MSDSYVDWTYTGPTDHLCGPGATQAERILAYGSAGVLTLLIVIADLTSATHVSASWWQFLLLLILAMDVSGGAVANNLNSCKRYYHGESADDEGVVTTYMKNARVFTALHLQPVLAGWAFGPGIWRGLVWYIVLQVAVWCVLAVPLYVRRAVATAITVAVIIVHAAWLPLAYGAVGLSWFIPCLFIKMVIGHAVQEEPYRPPFV